MVTQVQSRRGTTTQTNSFTGAAGEITVDTDKNVPVVHDGSTAGGFPVSRLAFKTISVSGQSDIVADSDVDTLTVAAGSNITLTTNAGTDTLTIAASGSGLTVGSSAIASGTTTRVLYDNAGTLGEYTISGSGTVVAMATSPSFTTPSLGAATGTTLGLSGVETITIAPAANTSGNGLTLTDTTAASAGNQQYSPSIVQSGQGWKTTATAASQQVDYRTEVRPVQGAAAPTGNYYWSSQINGGGFVDKMAIGTDGVLGIGGGSITFDLGTGNYQLLNNATVAAYIVYSNGYKLKIDAANGDQTIISGGKMGFSSSSSDARTAADTTISRAAANQLNFSAGANGQQTGIFSLTELTTIAAAATTDTAIQMPANSIVLGVSVRVTTAVTCTANFTVGDAGSAARFSTAAVSKAATSTDPGTKAGAYYNATATSVRITPDTNPSDATGRVRVTIHYIQITPPTS